MGCVRRDFDGVAAYCLLLAISIFVCVFSHLIYGWINAQNFNCISPDSLVDNNLVNGDITKDNYITEAQKRGNSRCYFIQLHDNSVIAFITSDEEQIAAMRDIEYGLCNKMSLNGVCVALEEEEQSYIEEDFEQAVSMQLIDKDSALVSYKLVNFDADRFNIIFALASLLLIVGLFMILPQIYRFIPSKTEPPKKEIGVNETYVNDANTFYTDFDDKSEVGVYPDNNISAQSDRNEKEKNYFRY